jgi:glycosyltransferase involved in cell wall biosynthesis
MSGGFPVEEIPAGLPGAPGLLEFELRLWRRLCRLHRTRPWDLVYSRSEIYAFGGCLAARTLGIPHVLELNGLRGTGLLLAGRPHWLANAADRLEAWAAAGSRRVVCVTPGLARYARDSLGIPGDRCVVLPNAVATARFASVPQPPPPPPLRVVFLGQFTRLQGVPTLVRAATRLSDAVRIQLVGSGPMEAQLRQMVARLGVADRVGFLPPVPHEDLPGLLGSFHAGVAVHSPRLFGRIGISPIKVATYLAAGLPVVAFRLPGLEFLEAEGLGRLVPPDDPSALARALEGILHEDAWRREASARAKAYARKHLDWEVRAARLRAVLEEVARDSRRPCRGGPPPLA